MKKIFSFMILMLVSLVLAACELDGTPLDFHVETNAPDVEIEVEPQEDITTGTEITLTAPAHEDYTFVHWVNTETDAVLSTENPYQFTLEESMIIAGIYEGDIAIDIVSDLAEATIDISPSEQVFEGENITIEAHAPEGYVFDHWVDVDTGEIFSDENPKTLVAEKSLNLEAIYVLEETKDAQTALEDFDGDFGHMEGLMENLEHTDEMEMEMNFSMIYETTEGEETIDVNLVQRAREAETMISETILTLSVPDMPEEKITMHMMVKETDDFYEAYVDIGFFLDMLEQEDDIDARELFDINSDMLHIVVPSELREEFSDLFLSALEEEFEEEAIDPETLEAVMKELEAMKATYDLAYFTALEGLIIEAEVVEETDILTTVEVNPTVMKTIFEDIFKDAYQIMLMVDEAGYPPYEEAIQMPEYQQILLSIDELETFVVSMYHTPSTEDYLTIHLNLYDYFATLEEGMDLDGLNAMDLTITMRDHANFTEIDEAKNVYDVAEEFFMMAILDESLNYLRNIDETLDLADDTYTLKTIMQEHFIHFHLPTIDMTNSTITIDAEDIIIDLVYEHNQASVFHEPISLSELEALGIDQEDPPENRAAFLAIIEPVNKDNLNIYQILIELMQFVEEMIPEDPVDPEPEPDFPEEDLVQFEDLKTIPRYPESMLVDGLDGDVEQVRKYIIEEEERTVYDYYLDYFFESDEWEILDTDFFGIESVGFFELASETHYADVVVNPSNTYENTTEIIIYTIEKEDDRDPSGEIPEEDTRDLDDIEAVPRYPESILIDGADGEDFLLRAYVSGDDPEDIYQYYLDHYGEAPDWTIIDQNMDVEDGEGNLTAVMSDMTTVILGFYISEEYLDAWEIKVQYSEEE